MSHLYLDSAYIAKFYVNEPDSAAVRQHFGAIEQRSASHVCIAEVASVFHRYVTRGLLSHAHANGMLSLFTKDIDDGVWTLLPCDDALLRDAATAMVRLNKTLPLRSLDAIHLQTARRFGFDEVWTNDRQMLQAAPLFGLQPRSV